MRGRIRGLEGARGIAAVAVFVFHAKLLHSPDGLGPVGWIIDRFWVGVTFFFVLSGLVLYRPFLQGKVAVGRYAVRRSARIIPAYWVALLVVMIAFPLSVPASMWRNFFFLQLYGPPSQWAIVPAWTLCIEVSFYALLPVVAFVVRGRPWLLALVLPANVAYVAVERPLGIATVTIADFAGAFALGMLAAIAFERDCLRGVARLWPAVLAAAFAASAYQGGRVTATLQMLLWASAFALLALTIARGHLLVFKTRAVVALGTISYAFYLYHFPLLEHLRWLNGPAMFVPALLVFGSIVAAVAALSWFVVERPILRLARSRRSPIVPDVMWVPDANG